MSGSPAEERIREKTEAALRRHYPGARIIHELVLKTGQIRIDLAAVLPDQLIVAEIKSERDTFKRLGPQVKAALAVASQVWVVVAEKHETALHGLAHGYTWGPPQPRVPPLTGFWRENIKAPEHNPELVQACLFVETVEGLRRVEGNYARPDRVADPRALFDLLWAGERRAALAPHGAPVSPRSTCDSTLRWAVENLSGRQVRQAVCARLLARSFPRADQAVRLAA